MKKRQCLSVQSIIGATENLLHAVDAGVTGFSVDLSVITAILVYYRLLLFLLIYDMSLLQCSKSKLSCSKNGFYHCPQA